MKKIIWLFILFSTHAFSLSDFNLEAGSVSNPYNRVALPGDDGTPFDLSKSLPDQNFYYRLSLSHKFKNSPHGVRLLYAPLKVQGDATYSKDINFGSLNFVGNKKINSEYQFNSYRASYFYQLIDEKDFVLRLGATLKVRDAKVKLSQDNQSKFKKNSGLVPLFYLFTEYKFAQSFRAAFDFDGWAAPQGRAFDGGLMLGYYFLPNTSLSLGYRILEGGADNDNVYNFSRLHYAFSSLQITF